ncbi:hypothetical protein MSAN_00186000 [Mycena sanguinolenta]|uniref:Protein CPL1-like domain-containing protein n=1 Tax=Mycena sanguinolenta TaxID=230812 RepID=A0A8H6ZHS4_9AGAR|nr:hypothetical protein MSAN_00186000 [Mycena sanguinolenta]
MRLAPTLILPSLLLPFVSAHARPGGSHHSSQSRSLSRLQYHQPRDLLNVCINVPETVVNVLGPDGLLNIVGPGGLLDGLLGIDLSVCLCIDDLNIFLNAKANVTINGQALAAIDALINAANNPNAQCAPLPAHAMRRCTTANPCAFDCTAPYTLSSDGTQCVCSSCPSAAARSLKSRRNEISTYADAKEYCVKSKGVDYEACGISEKLMAWECVDVKSPDSCGGCVVNAPFPDPKAARGVDCGSITNGEDVKCEEGKCVVQRDSLVSSTVTSQKSAGHKSRRDLLGLGGLVNGVLGGGSSSSVGSTDTQVLDPILAPLISNVVGSAGALSSSAPTSGCINTSTVSAPLLAVHAILKLDPLTIVADVKLAIGQVTSLQQTVQQCSSTGGSGPTGGNTGGGAGAGGLLKAIGDLLNNLTKLLEAFPKGGAPTVPSTSAADTQCFVLNLCALLHGPSKVTVCGSLGQALHESLQPTIDGLLKALGLDPTTCPKFPSAAPAPSIGAPSANAGVSVGATAPSVSAAASAASVPTPSAAVSAPGTPKPPSPPPSNLLDVTVNLKRRAFRTRHGHFARTDSSHILSPDMTLSMMRALTITTAITDMNAALPSGCETLLPTLGRLFASSSSSALQTNLVFAASVTQICKDSFSLANSNLDPRLRELVQLLLSALVTMRENKTPTVAQSTECPSVDESFPVCSLRMPISDFIRCSCGSQQLPEDTQEILGGPVPSAVQCSSVIALPASSVVTRSTVPAVVPPNPNNNVTTAADAVLTATLKANLLGGNMPFKVEAVQNLNSGMNLLLQRLVGSDLLKTGPTGTLGGEVANILNGGEDTLTADQLNQLVANVVSLAEKAKDSSDCKCSANADKLIATVNQLPALVSNLRDAVSRCGCAGTPLLDNISGLLSQNPSTIKAFQRLNA